MLSLAPTGIVLGLDAMSSDVESKCYLAAMWTSNGIALPFGESLETLARVVGSVPLGTANEVLPAFLRSSRRIVRGGIFEWALLAFRVGHI